MINRKKGEEVLVKSETIEITETEEIYSLRINKASMTDAGDYSLKLSNRLGQETKNASVTVKCKNNFFHSLWNVILYWKNREALAELRLPKILQGLNDSTVKKGEKLELQVRVRGQPNPQVEW